MMNRLIIDRATELGELLHRRRLRVTTAESCTGGLVAAAITAVAGSSAWFEYGWVVYSNEAKQNLLGVAAKTLASAGAVSLETVRELARNALLRADADLAVAVSGIAGPGGGSEAKPVGTVCFGWAGRDGRLEAESLYFAGDRNTVREQAVLHVLTGLIART